MLQGYAVGRLGKDAELKSTNEGKPVSNFSLAVDIGWGERKKTLWLDCTLWGKQAEALTEYLTKGKTVAVIGSLDIRTWISSQTNEAGGAIQMNVADLTLCGSAPADSKPAPSQKGSR